MGARFYRAPSLPYRLTRREVMAMSKNPAPKFVTPEQINQASQRIVLSGALPDTSYFAVWSAVDWLTHEGYAIVRVAGTEHGYDRVPDCEQCEMGR